MREGEVPSTEVAYRPRISPVRVTAVSWMPSLAEMSATLFVMAKCCDKAARVLPAATPQRARHMLPTHATKRNRDGKMGDSNSSVRPTSLIQSAKNRHCGHGGIASTVDGRKEIRASGGKLEVENTDKHATNIEKTKKKGRRGEEGEKGRRMKK